jgi:DNA-binding CsgD family transcriptional regulator
MFSAKGPYNFEEFVNATTEARTRDRLFDLFIRTMENFGYDRLNFSIMNDRDLSQLHQGFGLISTYPEAWRRHYTKERLQKIDPVVRFAVGNHEPFRWKDIERNNDLSRRQIGFLREGEDAGLHNGVGIPFAGPDHQLAGIALATSTLRAGQMRNLDVLAGFANHFYRVYKRLVGDVTPAVPPLAILTEREQEVLIRVAHGRTDLEIADALSIRPRTVDFHLQNIFLKLNVNTRAAAVAVALKSWLIEY